MQKRSDYNTIVLEGDCEKCRQPNVIALSYKVYRGLIKKRSSLDYTSGNESKCKFNCKYCHSKNSCTLLSWGVGRVEAEEIEVENVKKILHEVLEEVHSKSRKKETGQAT